MKRLIYLSLLQTAFCASIIAQSAVSLEYQGYPIIENFYTDELQIQEQNWDIVQDHNGIIYVANIQELIQYDGVSWTGIDIPNSTVRSVTFDKEGTIYVGSISDFGYLTEDSSNTLVYKSLLPLIDTDSIHFTSVYQSIVTNHGVYFRSSEYLMKYFNGKVTAWEAETRFGRMYKTSGHLYINIKRRGLHEIVNDEFIPVAGGELFANLFIPTMIEIDNGDILIGTRSEGLYMESGGNIKRYPTDIDEYIFNNRLYNGIKLNDGNIALATLSGGIIIIEQDGTFVNAFNKNNGLQDNNVKNIYQDNQNNIWAALNDGISRIEYTSPFEFYNRDMGLNGLVLSIIKKNNFLYAGTTNGLFVKIPEKDVYGLERFEKIESVQSLPWILFEQGNSILAGTQSGLFLVNGRASSQLSDDRVFSIINIPGVRDYVLLCTSNGLKLLNTINYKNTIKVFNELSDEIRSAEFDKTNNLWLGTLTKGVISIKNAAEEFSGIIANNNSPEVGIISHFGTEHGLPDGETYVSLVNGTVYFLTAEGLYTFEKNTNMFKPDSLLGSEFADGSRNIFRMVGERNGDIWFHSKVRNYLAEKHSDGSYEVIRKPFMRLPKDQVNIIYPDDKYVWFGTNKGIVRYDKNSGSQIDTSFSTVIRKVNIRNDSLVYGGAQLPDDFSSPKLDYKFRNLRFEYASPFYTASGKTRYQYVLKGYDDNWSDWTDETKKDYTNLSEGNYTFYVKAMNIYGDVSTTASYSFTISPPFYRTFWAYTFYFLAVLAFGYLIVKWRISKLEKEKRQLEILIDNKTREVKDQADKLKELDKIKSRFFANISHEFRTPLTLIIGPAEQMLTEEKSANKKKKFSLMLRNSQKLLGLINQLLDLSRLDNSRVQLHVKRINLVKLVGAVSSLFESMAVQKNIKLDFKADPNEIELYGDPDKIEKVVVNLISNAFKFSNESGSISVALSKTTGGSEKFEQGYAELIIRDTGIGVSGENLSHIFDPFYRGDYSIQKEIEGTGIGLALVKEFVELHGGTIEVQSEVDNGTTFTIKFPLGSEHLQQYGITEEKYEPHLHPEALELMDEEQEEIQDREKIQSDPEEASDKEIILVVEDNADVRSYIKESLENDYRIVEAKNGKLGLDAAMKIVPDLIVSDVMMPGIDGFEFCEKIKKDLNTSHIPVILLTAKSGDENIIKGLDTGADDYITKPFNVNILQTRIKNLIELRKQLNNKFRRESLLQPSEFKVSSLDDKFLMKLHKLLESNYSDPEFKLDHLIENFNISRASLFRKIKSLTGDTPNNYLQSYRLKRAAQMIKQNIGNITETAYSSGFSSSAYFTKCFKEKFDCLPSEYQARES